MLRMNIIVSVILLMQLHFQKSWFSHKLIAIYLHIIFLFLVLNIKPKNIAFESIIDLLLLNPYEIRFA